MNWITRNWSVVAAFFAIAVGGIEMRFMLGEALADLHEHVTAARPHPELAERVHGLTLQQQMIDRRLDAIEEGQSALQKGQSSGAAKLDMVIEELKALRTDLRGTKER